MDAEDQDDARLDKLWAGAQRAMKRNREIYRALGIDTRADDEDE